MLLHKIQELCGGENRNHLKNLFNTLFRNNKIK